MFYILVIDKRPNSSDQQKPNNDRSGKSSMYDSNSTNMKKRSLDKILAFLASLSFLIGAAMYAAAN